MTLDLSKKNADSLAYLGMLSPLRNTIENPRLQADNNQELVQRFSLKDIRLARME
jgi:hypothetical protein